MNVVFLSNYFSHHQHPLSEALAERSAYAFVATAPITRERMELGWGTEPEPVYVFHYDRDISTVQARIDSADVVIAGSAPAELVRRCIQRGQIVFRYAERPLKNGDEWLKFLPRLVKWHWQNPMGKPIFMLCASAFTAGDYARFGLFRGKTVKWGYFPKVERYPSIDEVMNGKKKHSVLWAGRFLDWKHPDDAIRVAAMLKADGIDFEMNLIGNGALEPMLREEISRQGLDDCVRLLGAMKPEEVRKRMEETEIFLFTSDRKEGWGAVLNESMNSGCAVVASDAAGAVPFLVQDGKNGYVYHSGNVDELYRKVKKLLEEPALIKSMGLAAYETMIQTWNGEAAAERFLQIAELAQKGQPINGAFSEGPCSSAQIMREDWYEG